MKILAILIVISASVAVAWMLLTGVTPFGPKNQKQVSRGASLYSENCAACHGSALEGQPDWQTPNPDGTYPAPPHNEDGHTWHHSDKFLFDSVKLGGEALYSESAGFNSAMPGFSGTLKDQEILDILAYINSFWSDRARQYQIEATQIEKETEK